MRSRGVRDLKTESAQIESNFIDFTLLVVSIVFPNTEPTAKRSSKNVIYG